MVVFPCISSFCLSITPTAYITHIKTVCLLVCLRVAVPVPLWEGFQTYLNSSSKMLYTSIGDPTGARFY
ncbi:hypothetical protein L1987_63806 [Smallanthus sonchifolius]|uniref:Uncharacterized protein n=1 Tax=Smallanthus sonchifolius TaxID=185202 RepID=A0ACB9CEC6_9ASTR|nr:hypothetical protein L1987_63806 [Smallanthus sonchifolius]